VLQAAFDDYENANLALKPEYASLVTEMTQQLEQLAEKWITPFNGTRA
jgi:hypothetical protein